MASGNPLDLSHLLEHINDAEYFHLPRFFTNKKAHGHINLPQPFAMKEPVEIPSVEHPLMPGHQLIENFDLRITKFMVLEIVAAIILIFVFLRVAGKIKKSPVTKGKLGNIFEAMLLFLRDEVARPAIGKDEADKFLPFLWTLFFFVLICNLLGMVPWLGSPTGSMAVTGTLAFIAFLVTIGSGMKKMGPIGFWTGQVPHMDLPGPLALFLKPMIFGIEVIGLVIKHFVLCVRLLANMMAGHIVLAVLLAFILVIAQQVTSYFSPMFVGVSVASVLAAVGISMLELFVAFLQAYIFTFLSALFIGMAVHPH